MNESGVRAMIQCVNVQINPIKSFLLFVIIMTVISPEVHTTSNGHVLA